MNTGLRLLIRIPVYLLESLLVLLIVYQSVLLFCMAIPVNSGMRDCHSTEAFVISNGVHTDICIPVDLGKDWLSFINPQDYHTTRDKIKYISFGWGDKGFYLHTPKWSDLKVSTAVEALLVNSPTAMHLTVKFDRPLESDKVKRIRICRSQIKQLRDYILDSFILDEKEFPLLINNAGYGKYDNFYEARGSYHLFETCNSWTNKALKIAGVCTSLKAFNEQGIMRHLN